MTEEQAMSASPDGSRPALKPRAFETIVYGGIAIGILDFFDALIFFGWYLGTGVLPVFQGVAAGILGRDAARAGGWNTWLLGVFLHFVVAFAIAAVFYLMSRVVPVLLRHPIVSGLIFGVIAHFVMQIVVIPLSAIGATPTFPLKTTLNGVIGHALLVGLPVALIAHWSARRNPDTK